MRRLLLYVGAIPGTVYGRQGKAYLKQHITRYNAAARHSAWVILIDLDNDAACAPTLGLDPRRGLGQGRTARGGVGGMLGKGGQHFSC
jgi:hypothetical protein